ncbi:hypothetical protein DERF_004330 [Dermatophagoides farinae]|uniref:Transmembrane protein n=1 Tax=Dermatophagoides farinae TaxID=6954 RepID=A0A922L9Y3_DERFA|nr:hypothetical protein DERF_004330 [Dermatophagoides farinae]
MSIDGLIKFNHSVIVHLSSSSSSSSSLVLIILIILLINIDQHLSLSATTTTTNIDHDVISRCQQDCPHRMCKKNCSHASEISESPTKVYS